MSSISSLPAPAPPHALPPPPPLPKSPALTSSASQPPPPRPASSHSQSRSSLSPSSASSSTPPSIPHIFQDLESRFLLNLPSSELSSFERLFFQLQQAQWFYLDFYHDRFPSLPAYNLKDFCERFFALSPLLSSHLSSFSSSFQSFLSYLGSVPVCGAVLLDPTLRFCLMVRAWKGNSWGFPRGKVDEGESELECALREVREEVGFDAQGRVDAAHYVEASVGGKHTKLFIVPGVELETHFETRTRKEISAIEWVEVSRLPSYKSQRAAAAAGAAGEEEKSSSKKYWNVMMFVDELRRWIAQKKREGGAAGKNNSNASGGKQKNSKQQQPHSNSGAAVSAGIPIPVPSHSSAPSSSSPSSSQSPALSTSPARSSVSRNGRASSSSASIDSNNASTFSSSGSAGWSAEEMFSQNERLYGVKSSVQEEKLDVPANIDEIMQRVLGHRYRGGGAAGQQQQRKDKENLSQQQQTQASRGGKQHRNTRSETISSPSTASPISTSASAASSPTAALPEQPVQSEHAQSQPPRANAPKPGRGGRGGKSGAATSRAARAATLPASGDRLNVQELDFSHNPYRHHALSISTASTAPSLPSPTPPSPAAQSTPTVKSATSPALNNHSTTERAQPHSAGVGMQKAAGAAAIAAGIGHSSSGRSSLTSTSKTVGSTEFSFDLDSILQPLSTTGAPPSFSPSPSA